MTPYKLVILLWYHVGRCGDPEEIRAPIGKETIDGLYRDGMLTENYTKHIDQSSHKITDKGAAYIRRVLDITYQ